MERPYLCNKEVVLDIQGVCYSFKVNGCAVDQTILNFTNNHEEADTKICMHGLYRDDL